MGLSGSPVANDACRSQGQGRSLIVGLSSHRHQARLAENGTKRRGTTGAGGGRRQVPRESDPHELVRVVLVPALQGSNVLTPPKSHEP